MKKEKTIDDFLKEIEVNNGNGSLRKHKIFDYEKMYQDEAFYFVLISERGRLGKTYGAKELGQKLYLENGYPFVYVKNLTLQIKKESKRFLKQVKDLEIFKNYDCNKEGVFTKEKNKTKYSCFFHSLNSAEKDKGSRTEANIVILDEFMDGTKHLEDNQTFLLKSILDTYDNPVNPFNKKLKKCFILGNFKTLNSKLLIDLNIFSIKNELTTINNSKGRPFIRVLCPQYNKEERTKIENDLEGDPIYEFGKISSQNDYSLFNDNVNDIINNIKTYPDSYLENHSIIQMILFYKKYNTPHYIFLMGLEQRQIHVLVSNKYEGTDKVYNLDKRTLMEEIPVLSRSMKKDLIRILENGNITFSDVFSREIFIDGILK